MICHFLLLSFKHLSSLMDGFVQIHGQEAQCLKESCSLLRAFVASKCHPIHGSGVGVALWLWEMELAWCSWAVWTMKDMLYAIPDDQINMSTSPCGFWPTTGIVSWFASLTLLLVLDSSQFGMDCHSNYRMCITFCSLIGKAAPLNQLS